MRIQLHVHSDRAEQRNHTHLQSSLLAKHWLFILMAQDSTVAYDAIKHLHKTLPAFAPYVPVGVLPFFAFILLAATFALAFYFSTLSKDTLPVRETAVALTASALGGFGVVALFCTVGVYV